MSAKRRPATDSSSNPAKRTKTTQQSPVDDIPRDPRWSKVSASANAVMEFKRIIARDPEKMYLGVACARLVFSGLTMTPRMRMRMRSRRMVKKC